MQHTHLKIIEQLRNELNQLGNSQTREKSKRFFREEIELYGIKAKDTGTIARKYYKQIKHLGKSDIFSLCETLWRSGMLEESFIACHWCEKLSKRYTADDIALFQKWIEQYVTNWASCDTFCNHSVGNLVTAFPQTVEVLMKWCDSPNRWMRRASAVSLIIPARNGLFLNESTTIAEKLLTDTDDMVQKGYGWLLKVCSQKNPDRIYRFVIERKAAMPRTALRYAIEKFPPAQRQKAMSR